MSARTKIPVGVAFVAAAAVVGGAATALADAGHGSRGFGGGHSPVITTGGSLDKDALWREQAPVNTGADPSAYDAVIELGATPEEAAPFRSMDDGH